jgi:hypothetical protein
LEKIIAHGSYSRQTAGSAAHACINAEGQGKKPLFEKSGAKTFCLNRAWGAEPDAALGKNFLFLAPRGGAFYAALALRGK